MFLFQCFIIKLSIVNDTQNKRRRTKNNCIFTYIKYTYINIYIYKIYKCEKSILICKTNLHMCNK